MSAQGRGGKKTPERLIGLLKEAVENSSQSAVARETGLTQSAIGRYIKGIGEPSQETLEKLAKYFGTQVAWLRGDTDDYGPMTSQRIEELSSVMLKRMEAMLELYTFIPDKFRDLYRSLVQREMYTIKRMYQVFGTRNTETPKALEICEYIDKISKTLQ